MSDCLLAGKLSRYVPSDVVLESGSVLESDSSTYFEDSDSDSDSNPRTRLDSVSVYLQLKEFSHDNIRPFIGASVQPGHICYLTQWCNRGTVHVRQDLHRGP